jgi:hypothetical protein
MYVCMYMKYTRLLKSNKGNNWRNYKGSYIHFVFEQIFLARQDYNSPPYHQNVGKLVRQVTKDQ